jgi:plastocyanin
MPRIVDQETEMPKVLAATALTFTVVLGLTACGSSSSSSGSDKSTTTTKAKAEAQAPVTLDGKVNNKGTRDVSTKGANYEMELEADDFYFEPTFIKAAPGQTIKLELKNEGSVAHTFTAPSLGIDQEVQPGTSMTVNVTAPMTGDAAFYCRFHKDNGMQGAIYTS